MEEQVKNTVSVENFKTTLIISEILITAIVLIGFYLIFNQFMRKNKSFREKDKNNSRT